MADNGYVVNGIKLSSESEYQLAKKEYDGILYIKEQNDMSDDRVVLALYNKFVQKKVFRSRVGYKFLEELQSRLMRSSVIDKSTVAKLPIYDFEEDKMKAATPVQGKSAMGNAAAAAARANTTMNSETAMHARTTTSNSMQNKASSKSNIHMEYLHKNNTNSNNKTDDKAAVYKSRFGWSLFINIILILVIAAMAYITLNSNNINILNYEEKLQDEYSSWEEKLTLKEKELKALEKELREQLGN
ncbi:MAG: hypothetical protein IJW18_07260 [Lachnospiraceae bacterium]|nr:hypothetical protein [Lachnospiraceae bacterium]